MQVDKLSISLPQSLLTFLADYQHTHAVGSPSDVIIRVLELLREQELATLAQANEASAEAQPTVLQRMGGLSDRETRRAVITERIQARQQSRSQATLYLS